MRLDCRILAQFWLRQTANPTFIPTTGFSRTCISQVDCDSAVTDGPDEGLAGYEAYFVPRVTSSRLLNSQE